MLKIILSLSFAAGLTFAVSPAGAMTQTPQVDGASAPQADDTQAPQVTLIYDGCGPYGHRGPYGGCRAGGQWGGYGWGRACPVGFHLGPRGRYCWPN